MKTFRDNQDHVWTLALTLTKVRRLAETIGVDLLNPDHFMRFMQSLTDQLTIIWLLVERQAKDEEISDPDEFELRMYGDDIASKAQQALMLECSDFFQKLGRLIQAKQARRMAEAIEAELAWMQTATTGEIDSLFDESIKEVETKLRESGGATLSS